MRTAVLIAVALLAACSHATVNPSEPATTTSSGVSRPATTSSTPPPANPPPNGAPISDVIGWVEAGRPADAGQYHSATRDGEITKLGDDIAFTTPGGGPGATACMTDSHHAGGALACLVNLAHPPPRPADVYGEWKGNWVDFDGTALQVGSAHGDPGPFASGDGPKLPDGAALSFGDYRCRADHADLVCVNYAHRSAVRMGPGGVEPFGCLQPAPVPEGAGRYFRC